MQPWKISVGLTAILLALALMLAGTNPALAPCRGRHAQERLAPGASHAPGQDEGVTGRLLPARRLHL